MAFNPAEHMMPLKGKEYLQVMWRLVWFREEHPLWTISTDSIEIEEDHAIFRATISDENGRELASGHGSESKRDFGDFLEKAETKAIGRALAILGYGTQFAPEMDECDRIVDSPVERKKPKEQKKTEDRAQKKSDNPASIYTCTDCGKPVVDIDFNGQTYSKEQILKTSFKKYNRYLCYDCYKVGGTK